MQRVNILYQFDDNYAPHAGISMTSLLENCDKSTELYIYCAAMNVSLKNRMKMEELVKEHGQHLIWLDIDKAIEYINSCKTGEWNGSKATWIKIFVIQDLPEDVETILYLDSDTIVTGDLAKILDIDISGHSIACAYDSVAFKNGKMLGLDHYYNAGVIYYNVKKWKEPGFFENLLEHLYKNVEKYPDNDQRLLNDYLRDDVYTLSPVFNYQGLHFLYNEKQFFPAYKGMKYYTPQEIASAKKEATVHHFFRILGDYPWEEGNLHPLKEEYEEWKEKSKWADEPVASRKRPLVFQVERILFRLLPKKLFLKIYRMICDSKITY